ncbi:MAG: LysR family transcriptional regulator [Alphaproteobacteria bacterium]
MFQPFDRTRHPSFNRTLLDDPRVRSGDFWAELRVFLAVAKSKSFNRAAEELGISHPTVARNVRRLQDVMGSQLLVSSPAGISLTDKGKELAGALVELDERLFGLSRHLRGESREAEGLVRISVTEGLSGLFVVPNLTDFNERFPNIQLHIRNSINLARFRENHADIALRFMPADESGITSTPLGYLHFIPIANPIYFTKYGVPTRDTLKQHRFVDSEYYSLTTPPWDAWRNIVAQGKTVSLCDNSYSYAFMVKAGLGIGLLGNYLLSDPSMVPLDLDVHIRLPIYLQVESERLQARPVRAVHDWLCELFSVRNPVFAPELALGSYPTMSATISQIYASTPYEHSDSLSL